MSARRQILFWGGAFAVFITIVWLLSAMLLPFVVGMAIAYLLDPLVDGCEARGMSRVLGTCVVLAGVVVAGLLTLLLLFPLLRDQAIALGAALPEMLVRAQDLLGQAVAKLRHWLPQGSRQELGNGLNQIGANAAGLFGEVVGRLWSGGMILFDVLSILLITPVVAFYLLRDWDRMIARIDSWLPRAHAPTIRAQMAKIDTVLSGFVRGQTLVCLISGVLYALGWTLVGVDFAVVIGMVAGLLAFIPYVGGFAGLSIALLVGIGEAGLDWTVIGLIFAVYLTVQTLEGSFYQPRMVGKRVDLHDLWIIFALLAGGTLFGFLGVLLAVPAAAAIGVLVRFALDRYLASPVYRGEGGP